MRIIKGLARPEDRTVLLVLAAITLLRLGFALWTSADVNPLRFDSPDYLYFDPSRPVGYPAFLALVRLTTGHVAYAVPLQTILLAGSFLLLGWSFHRFCRRPWLSFAFQALLLSSAAIWKASAFLLTEGLATALAAAWCAQLLRMLTARTSRGALLLLTISALATMVRPSLVALFIGSAIYAIVVEIGAARGRALIAIAAGVVLTWAATPAALYLVNGSSRTTSPFARGVLQHTLFCEAGTVSMDADAAFVEHNAAIVRAHMASAPANMQVMLQRLYSSPLRFGLFIPVLGERHHLSLRSEVDPYLSRIAKQRVKANPLCYARSVAGAYIRMATYDTTRTRAEARRIQRFLDAHPPVQVPELPMLPGDAQLARRAADELQQQVSRLHPERDRFDVGGNTSLSTLILGRLLYGGAALIGLLALLALPFRRRIMPDLGPALTGAAAMGAGFHGTMAITALVELGMTRYLVPAWPIACALVGLAVAALIDRPKKAERAIAEEEAIVTEA